jgi:YHS domain-containing protein
MSQSAALKAFPYALAVALLLFILFSSDKRVHTLRTADLYNEASSGCDYDCYDSSLPLLKGRDVVAYFSLSFPEPSVQGSSEYAYVYKNTIYYFASEENLNTFKNSSETYAPQWGSFCAWGIAAEYEVRGTQRSNLD